MRSNRFVLAAAALLAAACCRVPGTDSTKPSPATTAVAGGHAATPAPTATDHTPVPTSAEWNAAGRLTTNNDGCEAKGVREWIQVWCRHCENDKRPAGHVCSEKASWDQAVVERGAHTDVSLYFHKGTDKSVTSAAVFPLRARGDFLLKFPGEGARDVLFRGVWPQGTPGPQVGFE